MNIWRDPERWVDSDHRRDAWLDWFVRGCAIGALSISAVIAAGAIVARVLS